MKKSIKFLSMLLCASALFAVSCGDDDPATQPDPTPDPAPMVILSPTTLEVGASGGECSTNYVIENPVEEATFTITNAPEWVTYTVGSYAIKFTVAANQSEEPRTATLTVEYPYIEAQEITINQAGYSAETNTIEVPIGHVTSYEVYGNEWEFWFFLEDNSNVHVFDIIGVDNENLILPDGTYSTADGSIVKKYCAHNNFSEQGKISEATMEVENSDDMSEVTINLNWVYNDQNYSINWTGKIEGMSYSNLD